MFKADYTFYERMITMKTLKKIKRKAVVLLLTVLLIFSISATTVGAAPASFDECTTTAVTDSVTEVTGTATPDETVPPSSHGGNYGFWIGIGAVVVGGLIATAVIGIKAKKDEDEDE